MALVRKRPQAETLGDGMKGPPMTTDYPATVAEVMTKAVITAKRTDEIGFIRDAMLNAGIHCLPVADDAGHPVGIVTSWDLVEEYGPQEAIENAMSSKVIKIGAHNDVIEAAKTMQTEFVHHLVVVNEANKIVGVLSSLDLLGALIDE